MSSLMRFTPHVVNMAVHGAVEFSRNGDLFAYSSPDGTLKLWDTDVGTLKQEYTPSSHLSATCTCLAWSPLNKPKTPKNKKKKRKSEVGPQNAQAEFIAMGTLSGSILIYSTLKGDLHTHLTGGHSDAVNGVCWNSEGNELYSCSDDHHIVHWDLIEGKVKHKWKGDKGTVNSLCLCPTQKHLISAGRKIKLWDLDKYEILKTFTGHATEVFRLLTVSSQNLGPEHTHDTLEGTYALSAAVGDRVVNAWQLNPDSELKQAVASFALPDEAIYTSFRQPISRDQPFILLAITKSGQLLIFEHVLNGFCKAPIKAKICIQIATESSKNESPRPLPVLGAYLTKDLETSVLISHGTFIKPVFEKLQYKTLEPNMCLVRQDPTKRSIHLEQSISKVQTPSVSKDVTTLAPGHMAPSKPTLTEKPIRKRRKSDSGEMPMADRLNAMSMDKSSASRPLKELPRADTLATLLAQGLQSKDKKILNNVLQHTNDTTIGNTVKRLPVPLVVPLVQELAKRMYGHAQSGHTLVKWVKTVLTVHTSYLTTYPELVDTLGSLYQMMDSRVSLFNKLSKLQGKLDLMLTQVSSQTDDKDDAPDLQPAMLVYQDESSDDEDLAMGTSIHGQSDSEDNWEEMDDEDEDSKGKDSDSDSEDEDLENGIENMDDSSD